MSPPIIPFTLSPTFLNSSRPPPFCFTFFNQLLLPFNGLRALHFNAPFSVFNSISSAFYLRGINLGEDVIRSRDEFVLDIVRSEFNEISTRGW